MYTKDDYVHDLYIKEHGSGMEQAEAAFRCRLYEAGKDPSYELSDYAINERKKKNEKMQGKFAIPLIVSILIAIISALNMSTTGFVVGALGIAISLFFGRYI